MCVFVWVAPDTRHVDTNHLAPYPYTHPHPHTTHTLRQRGEETISALVRTKQFGNLLYCQLPERIRPTTIVRPTTIRPTTISPRSALSSIHITHNTLSISYITNITYSILRTHLIADVKGGKHGERRNVARLHNQHPEPNGNGKCQCPLQCLVTSLILYTHSHTHTRTHTDAQKTKKHVRMHIIYVYYSSRNTCACV